MLNRKDHFNSNLPLLQIILPFLLFGYTNIHFEFLNNNFKTIKANNKVSFSIFKIDKSNKFLLIMAIESFICFPDLLQPG